MFKIISTIEKGRPTLSIVPGGWEVNGVLYWPRTKAEKLVKDANSLPSTGWFELPCKLKRKNLPSYEQADNELKKMLCEDETADDTDEGNSVPYKKKAKVLPPKRNATFKSPQANFNSLVELIMEPPSSVPCAGQSEAFIHSHKEQYQVQIPSLVRSNSSMQGVSQDILFDEQSGLQQQLQSFVILNNSGGGTSNVDNIEIQATEDLTEVEEPVIYQESKLDKILTNQLTILGNQMKIIQEIAKHEILLDEIIKNSNTKNTDSLAPNKCLSHGGNKTNADFANPIEPIDSAERLVNLNDKLKEKKEFEKLLEKMSFVCGTRGKGYGIDHCYTLVDKFFTRSFMTKCSWAGGSRDKNEKIPFKIYKNVINLFFQLVYLADNDFTLDQCETFFKNVIRNSTRRNESAFLRSSKSKRRPRKLEYKAKQPITDEAKEDSRCLQEAVEGQKDMVENEGESHSNSGSSDEDVIAA